MSLPPRPPSTRPAVSPLPNPQSGKSSQPSSLSASSSTKRIFNFQNGDKKEGLLYPKVNGNGLHNEGNNNNGTLSRLEATNHEIKRIQSTLAVNDLQIEKLSKQIPDDSNLSTKHQSNEVSLSGLSIYPTGLSILLSLFFIALAFATSFQWKFGNENALGGQLSLLIQNDTITKPGLILVEVVSIIYASYLVINAGRVNREIADKSRVLIQQSTHQMKEMIEALNKIEMTLKVIKIEGKDTNGYGELRSYSPDTNPILNNSSLSIQANGNHENGTKSNSNLNENIQNSTSGFIIPDPYSDDMFTPRPGYRLNWMEGTGVPFEPELEALTEKQRNAFRAYSEMFLRRFESCTDVDRNKFYQTPDNFTMLRFLQADDYNIEKAVNRLIGTCIWRQKSGFDDFVSNPHKDALRLYFALRPRQILGIGVGGRPSMVERIGAFFSDETLIQAMPLHLWIMCYSFDLTIILESFRQTSQKHNRMIHHINYIGDLNGSRLWASIKMMPFLKELTKEVEMHFPEIIGQVSLINSSFVVEKSWNIAKRFLDPKVSFIGLYIYIL